MKRFARTLGLIWNRLGAGRIYIAIALCILVTLASVGAWHVFSSIHRSGPQQSANLGPSIRKPTEQIARPVVASPIPTSSLTSPAPTARAEIATDLSRLVSITDVKQTKKIGRRGETIVVATIGLTPRSNAEKGDVGIHVFFFDLTPSDEMRPTDAQVTYQWLTPVRDWSDPSPKYLAATYLQAATNQARENLRYGGFIVRVYVGGKLQDERSEPEGFLSALKTSGKQTLLAPNPSTIAVASATPASVPTPNAVAPATTNVASTPPVAPSLVPSLSRKDLPPVGKPVPGKPGFVSSPFDPKFIIDVRGFPPGTLVNDPNTDKTFRVP